MRGRVGSRLIELGDDLIGQTGQLGGFRRGIVTGKVCRLDERIARQVGGVNVLGPHRRLIKRTFGDRRGLLGVCLLLRLSFVGLGLLGGGFVRLCLLGGGFVRLCLLGRGLLRFGLLGRGLLRFGLLCLRLLRFGLLCLLRFGLLCLLRFGLLRFGLLRFGLLCLRLLRLGLLRFGLASCGARALRLGRFVDLFGAGAQDLLVGHLIAEVDLGKLHTTDEHRIGDLGLELLVTQIARLASGPSGTFTLDLGFDQRVLQLLLRLIQRGLHHAMGFEQAVTGRTQLLHLGAHRPAATVHVFQDLAPSGLGLIDDSRTLDL